MGNQFDEIIDRYNTNSVKYDFKKEYGKPQEAIPLWVADMDFKTAPGILESLSQTVSHGIFGYSSSKEDYFFQVSQWYLRNFNWKVEEEWLIKTPGVIFAIAAAIRGLTQEGQGVLIQEPVYYPFRKIILKNKRKVVRSNLVLVNGKYQMDLEDFENQIIQQNVKLYILCSPHNPVGRVWTREELQKVGDICKKHQVYVISDEIHSDFTYAPYKHHVFTTIDPDFADFTITCTSPSKTFNLAGLQISNIFISNPKIKKAVEKAIGETGYGEVNILGINGCKAAYETGQQWLTDLKEYLQGNLDYLRNFLQEKLPEILLIEPEGTYLVWLDFRKLNYTETQREALLLDKANLWLDSGVMFGENGLGFERINIACPKAILADALNRLYAALRE